MAKIEKNRLNCEGNIKQNLLGKGLRFERENDCGKLLILCFMYETEYCRKCPSEKPS